eukprot:1159156-Pelagomonas_calceolata.AAC.23
MLAQRLSHTAGLTNLHDAWAGAFAHHTVSHDACGGAFAHHTVSHDACGGAFAHHRPHHFARCLHRGTLALPGHAAAHSKLSAMRDGQLFLLAKFPSVNMRYFPQWNCVSTCRCPPHHHHHHYRRRHNSLIHSFTHTNIHRPIHCGSNCFIPILFL